MCYRLDSACIVKVSDGALAQQFHPECYYTLFGATRPVRWAAVETLQEGLCTARSNVVSRSSSMCIEAQPVHELNGSEQFVSLGTLFLLHLLLYILEPAIYINRCGHIMSITCAKKGLHIHIFTTGSNM